MFYAGNRSGERTGADHALGDVQFLYSRKGITTLGLVVGRNLPVGDIDVVLRKLSKAVELLEKQVEDVQPSSQDRGCISVVAHTRTHDRQDHSLHIVERVEQRVDELRRHLHEARQVGLHGIIDVLVLVRRNLEILLELSQLGISAAMQRCGAAHAP